MLNRMPENVLRKVAEFESLCTYVDSSKLVIY